MIPRNDFNLIINLLPVIFPRLKRHVAWMNRLFIVTVLPKVILSLQATGNRNIKTERRVRRAGGKKTCSLVWKDFLARFMVYIRETWVPFLVENSLRVELEPSEKCKFSS